MTKDYALDRLRAICSRSEYCSGKAIALLKKWQAKPSGLKKRRGSDEQMAAGKAAGDAGKAGEGESGKEDVLISGGEKPGVPGLSDRDIAEIISVLVSERFIDDTRFANAFVRDKLRFNGWGKQKIVYNLKSFGISDEIISEAMQKNYFAADGGEEGRENGLSGQKVLEKLIEKKWKSLHKEESLQKRREKVMRFAISRGFEYSAVIETLSAITKQV